ncbi:NAD(P)H-hydrate dehydratase [Vibrio sp. SM6]|uniref:Bifunctional NAD(P)H-hydrate repair enzyme n=1 Tax=Vibrio agarilyticus TaxID=2726741 RepID=A0A7X8TNP0_9VIBR|nr:NAD(P)H-hydrate dehydratase [Vibrio agarilyticus]NLS12132.1 NAD(P)H-hydrate dehydratase [Vibrio agarilyticus]
MNLQTLQPLFSPEQIRRGERTVADEQGIELYQLMLRAGKAVAAHIIHTHSATSSVLVLCGGGNNGGDGYVTALELQQAGLTVQLVSTIDTATLSGDALRAFQQWVDAGNEVSSTAALAQCISNSEMIVDAILGTGLSGPAREEIASIIDQVNASQLPIISVDIPSGLNAAVGIAEGSVIRALETITFIGIKKGLVTGAAREYVGKLHLQTIAIGDHFIATEPTHCFGMNASAIAELVKRRKMCAHKGDNGRLILFGGHHSMSGAIRMATHAALRGGAGLVKVITHPDSRLPTQLSCPEAMVDCFIEPESLVGEAQVTPQPDLSWAQALVLGPGLSQSNWGRAGYQAAAQLPVLKVLDADALNLLSLNPQQDAQRILTPHPGEAARLLGVSITEIEQDRYQAVRQLQQKYGGVVVLKGAGTLIDDGETTYVCRQGNPGMATGGMGDVLAGLIGALLAQKYDLLEAALLGVLAHSSAADLNVQHEGVIGLLASDVIDSLRMVLNQIVEIEHPGTKSSSVLEKILPAQ